MLGSGLLWGRAVIIGLRHRPWLPALVAAAAMVLVMIVPALANPPVGGPLNVFQLEGNTAGQNDATNVDWSDLYNGGSGLANPPTFTSSIVKCTSIGGSVSTNCYSAFSLAADKIGKSGDVSYFTGGGSKDRNDLNLWQWIDNDQSPDKNDIFNAVATSYRTASGQVIFFGADRHAVNGDAQMGFWFFSKQICLMGPVGSAQGDCPATTPTGNAGKFVDALTGEPATHSNGDLLAVINYNNGGAIGLAAIYRWSTALGLPELVLTGSSTDCKTVGGAPDFCTTVNTTNLPGEPPWPYTGKANPNTSYLTSAFIEGGMNLAAIPGAASCFPTFMAETRSSSGPSTGLSLDATLKDFAIQTFQQCGSTTTTTPTNATGTPIPAGGISIGTGSVQVKDQAVITVEAPGAFNGNVKFFLCGPIPTSTTCTNGGAQIGDPAGETVSGASPVIVNSAAAAVTSAGRYCWRAVYSGDPSIGLPGSSDARETECFIVNPVQTALTTQAGAGPVPFGNPVSDTANLTGTATQPGTNGPNATYPSINANNGAPAGGTITFTLVKNDCTTLATGTGTNPQNVAVSGNGTYGPVSFTPDAPGTYHWKASYSGSLPNTLGTTHNGTCSDSSETVVVEQIPTQITTTPKAYPNDSATISSTKAGDNIVAGGTVVFKLFGPTAGATALQNCDANGTTGQLYTQTITPVGGGSSVLAETTNYPLNAAGITPVAVSTNQTVYWRVTYAPAASDTAHKGVQSACVENTTFTFTGDSGPGTTFP